MNFRVSQIVAVGRRGKIFLSVVQFVVDKNSGHSNSKGYAKNNSPVADSTLICPLSSRSILQINNLLSSSKMGKGDLYET